MNETGLRTDPCGTHLLMLNATDLAVLIEPWKVCLKDVLLIPTLSSFFRRRLWLRQSIDLRRSGKVLVSVFSSSMLYMMCFTRNLGVQLL